MAGSSAYPGGLDDFAESTPSNLGDEDASGRTHSERHDDLESAIEAIQATLGIDPAGSYSTVVERLDDVSTGGGGGAGWPQLFMTMGA